VEYLVQEVTPEVIETSHQTDSRLFFFSSFGSALGRFEEVRAPTNLLRFSKHNQCCFRQLGTRMGQLLGEHITRSQGNSQLEWPRSAINSGAELPCLIDM
jgi:hypothetical protein